MSEPRRRRRSDDDYGRGGLPLFPLVIVVILAGLLLGGGLAHFFGGDKTPKMAPTSVAALPSPIETSPPPLTAARTAMPLTTPAPTVSPRATKSPRPTMAPSATVAPSLTPSARPSAKSQKPARVVAAATATPSPVQTATPAGVAAQPPVHVATQPPAHKLATPASTPVAGAVDDNASSVVRSYLAALARGDRTTAATYLSHGLPSETFMNGDAHIESIRATSVGPERYHVTADVLTSGGEYYATFTVEQGPSGLQIADHYWIKPQ